MFVKISWIIDNTYYSFSLFISIKMTYDKINNGKHALHFSKKSNIHKILKLNFCNYQISNKKKKKSYQ